MLIYIKKSILFYKMILSEERKILKNTNNKIELLDENDYYILYEIVNIQQILPRIENAQFKEKIKQMLCQMLSKPQ